MKFAVDSDGDGTINARWSPSNVDTDLDGVSDEHASNEYRMRPNANSTAPLHDRQRR